MPSQSSKSLAQRGPGSRSRTGRRVEMDHFHSRMDMAAPVGNAIGLRQPLLAQPGIERSMPGITQGVASRLHSGAHFGMNAAKPFEAATCTCADGRRGKRCGTGKFRFQSLLDSASLAH